MIVKKCLNYGLGESTLWLVFMFEKILSTIGVDESRVIVNGFQLDSPKFDQKNHPTITIQELKKGRWTNTRLGGNTSTSITRTRKYTFGLSFTGDQGKIYETFYYHYYNGSPQFKEWNCEFLEKFKVNIPEWGSDEDVDINNFDSYGAGDSLIVSFIHSLDYSSSTDNLQSIRVSENSIKAEYE